MENRETREFIHKHILDHITNHIFNNLMNTNMPSTSKSDLIDSLYTLSHQRNLSAITNEDALKDVFNYLIAPEKLWCRWDFITKLTISLKFELGGEKEWNELIHDVYHALSFENDVGSKQKSLMSQVNRKLTKPDITILHHNHWLVPIILMATYHDLTTHISARQIECETILTAPGRRRGQ